MQAFWQTILENYNTLVVLAGVSLLGASSGIIGAFAVLRKRALTGDALSHAALPGLCLAFLLLRERQLLPMLLGALASGVAGIAIISALSRWTRIKDDASIGTVLTVFFGLGIVLLKIIQNLEGVGSKAGLNSYIFGKTAGMTRGDVYVIALAATLCLGLIVLFYKEFQLVSFDGDFARSLGWPVYAIDLLLMSLVAAAVVIGLPNVGVVLVSALLIMPGAAARFWTDRLSSLLVLAACFGFLTGLVGTALSATFNQLPAGPVIVLSGASMFMISLICGTRRGALVRLQRHLEFQRQWRQSQLLQALWEIGEGSPGQRTISRAALLAHRTWSARQVDHALRQAVADGFLAQKADGIELTATGKSQAVEVTRGHRLWEAYLTTYPDQAGSALDLSANSIADVAPPTTVALLTENLQAAGRWPLAEGSP